MDFDAWLKENRSRINELQGEILRHLATRGAVDTEDGIRRALKCDEDGYDAFHFAIHALDDWGIIHLWDGIAVSGAMFRELGFQRNRRERIAKAKAGAL